MVFIGMAGKPVLALVHVAPLLIVLNTCGPFEKPENVAYAMSAFPGSTATRVTTVVGSPFAAPPIEVQHALVEHGLSVRNIWPS